MHISSSVISAPDNLHKVLMPFSDLTGELKYLLNRAFWLSSFAFGVTCWMKKDSKNSCLEMRKSFLKARLQSTTSPVGMMNDTTAMFTGLLLTGSVANINLGTGFFCWSMATCCFRASISLDMHSILSCSSSLLGLGTGERVGEAEYEGTEKTGGEGESKAHAVPSASENVTGLLLWRGRCRGLSGGEVCEAFVNSTENCWKTTGLLAVLLGEELRGDGVDSTENCWKTTGPLLGELLRGVVCEDSR
jgi:hypothetical protein